MKLATLKDGSRDGKLVVVSRDLTRFTDASFLVPTLQAALDDWSRIAPHLATMAESLETGAVPSARFHEHDAHSPLPRAYGRIEVGSSSAQSAEEARHVSSDGFVGPRDPIEISGSQGVESGGEVAVIVDDVARGATVVEARQAIRLVLLGSGAAFSPVAVTPDELGNDWNDGRMNLPLSVEVKGGAAGKTGAGSERNFSDLIAYAARTRALAAGTIVGSGSSGRQNIVLRPGDTIRIEMKKGSQSIFGAIEQTAQAG